MGINAKHMAKIRMGLDNLGVPLEGLKMGEFGAQRLVLKTYPKKSEYQDYDNSKKYFKSLGIVHVSFDTNGKWDSLKVDLSKIHSDWQGHFDIVTDYGTSEHVRGGQYQVFANIHNFVRVGGVMCHGNPMIGRMQMGHPAHDSVYYHPDFYSKLANLNGYEVIDIEIMRDARRTKKKGGDLTSVLKKVNDRPFCSEEDFWSLKAIDDYSEGQALTKDRFKFGG
jgi:hypothetical protein